MHVNISIRRHHKGLWAVIWHSCLKSKHSLYDFVATDVPNEAAGKEETLAGNNYTIKVTLLPHANQLVYQALQTPITTMSRHQGRMRKRGGQFA